MPSISKAWVAEARTLAGISASVTITMLAQLAISTVEILIIARLGIHELAGVALALSIDLLVFLATLGIVTAVTPLAAASPRSRRLRAPTAVRPGGTAGRSGRLDTWRRRLARVQVHPHGCHGSGC